MTTGSRYKKDLLADDDDDDGVDFSRDISGDENIGIGIDDSKVDARGILFDDEDLFGSKKERTRAGYHTNNTKMVLDELVGDGEVAETD